MAKKVIFTDSDHQRIANAIRTAEKSTRGEIYCVVARQSDDYFFPSAFFCALAILVGMVPAAFLVGRSWEFVPHAVLPLAALAALAAALTLVWFSPSIRILFVPRFLRYRRASANAVNQFLGHNIHVTEARTGVLIFVSLAERYAEVVADSGINEMVDQKCWDEIVGVLVGAAADNRLADGFVEVVEATALVLTEHFPANGENPNELEDRLVEI